MNIITNYLLKKLREHKQWNIIKQKFAELIQEFMSNFPVDFHEKYEKILKGLSEQFDLDLYLYLYKNPNCFTLPTFTETF